MWATVLNSGNPKILITPVLLLLFHSDMPFKKSVLFIVALQNQKLLGYETSR